MKKINKIRKIQRVLIVLVLIFVFLSPSVTRFVKFPKRPEKPGEPMVPWYDPNLADFLYVDSIDQPFYPFNAYNESYIMCNIQNTAYGNFTFNNTMYNVSYGLNTIPIDFGVTNESYSIEISQHDIDRDIFDWITVEPLFIKDDVIEVNTTSKYDIEFDAGGPITILLQPNFSYNYLYLECLELSSKQIVLKNVFDPAQGYPDIDSQAYSSLIEEGRYISFDLNLKPGTHLMKVSGYGSINYKIVVNMDWDDDLLSDVDEIQKNAYYDFDPTIPNIWGFFEKGDSMLTNYGDGINEGEFSFYVPDSLKEQKFLFIDMFSGDFSEFNVNGDSMTLKDRVFSTDYLLSNEKSQFYGEIKTGWNDIQYKFNSDKPSIISFRLNSETVPVIDYRDLLDTDGDNLKDFVEEKSGLDPYKSDTDDDGIPDNYDGSPLSYLVLDKSKMCQIVVPHNKSRNTFISVMIQKPFPDHSTYSTPCLWMNTYNVSIYLVMRLFGNSTIIRDDLVSFWKGDSSNVENYCLIDDYNCSGVGDAIPNSYNPESEFTFINGNPSNKTFDFEINFPKGHSAKNDTALDIRFDFIWLVSYYNKTSGETEIFHYYDMEEDIIVQSITRRETDNVTYALASPDSMVEHQIIWNLAQNSELGNFTDYNVDDDILGSGFIDYLEMPDQVIEDRENNPIDHGETFTSILRPNGDVLTQWNNGVIPPHYAVLNETTPNGIDIQETSDLKYDEWDFTTTDLGENIVKKLKIFVYGKIEGATAIWTDWRIGNGNYNSEMALHTIMDTEWTWKTATWEGLSLTRSDLDNLRIRVKDYLIWGRAHIDTVYVEITYGSPKPIENEVLYVSGLQSNYDILNKINIIENIPDPSFEVNFSGEYEVLFSFCSISNDVSGMSNIFNQESKTCFLISWHNYTQNGIEDYQQRVKVQDYPISLKLLNFTDAYVLEISNAFGNEIPTSQIPTSINDPLHEKIILKNQTLIENKNEDFIVPTIVFVEGKDEIKIVRDYRLDDVIRADLFFIDDPVSGAFKLTQFFKICSKIVNYFKDNFMDLFEIFIRSFESLKVNVFKAISRITPRYWGSEKYKALIDCIKDFLNEDNWQDQIIILEIIENYNYLIKNTKISPQFEIQLKELRRELKRITDITKKFKLKVISVVGVAISILTFAFNIYEIFFQKSEGDLNEDIRRILSASLGIVISIISVFSIYWTWRSIKSIMSHPIPSLRSFQFQSLTKATKFLGDIIMVLGWAIAIVNVIFDIIKAVEIWDEDPNAAIQLIFKTIVINIGIVIGLDVLFIYAGLGAKATFGISLLFAFLILLLSWLPTPRPKFQIKEEGTGVTFPVDDIIRHGTLEVGDTIGLQLRMKNIGDYLLQCYLKFRLRDSNSTWVGDWSDVDEDLWWGINEYTSAIFERELEEPVLNLTGEIHFDVDYWDMGPISCYNEIEKLYFNMPVLENNIMSFSANTIPLEPLYNLEALELMLKLAMENYLWKDANDLLNSIQEIDPEYGGTIEIPGNANLGTNLRENIVVMDTTTDTAQFDFNIILEGTDDSVVNYTIIVPDDFSITSSELTQALNLNVKFNITADNPYPLAGIYYFDIIVTPSDNDTLIYKERIPFRIPIVEDFQITQPNIIFEETGFDEVYLAPYDFHNDNIGENPVGWTINEEFGCTVDVIEGYADSNGQYHDKVVELDWSGSQEHYEACWMEKTISELGISDITFEFWACVDYDIEYGWITLFTAENEYGNKRVGVEVQGDYFNTTHNEVWFYPAGYYGEEAVIWDGMKIDEWYHFSLHYIADVNCTFTVRDSNGKILLNDWRSVQPYQYHNDIFTINCGLDSGGEDYNVYIDAIGHTGDKFYSIGDNLYPTGIASDVYQNSTQLEKGDVLFVEYRTTSYDEKLLTFLNNDVIQATYTVIPRGNQFHYIQYQEIIIDDTFLFDEIKFSEIYGRGYNRFEVKKLSIIDAGITVSEKFNPMNFSNNGNIPEFVVFDFSGVPFENIDQSLYPDEFYEESQITTLLPGSQRNSEFNITLPEEPISNILWRGITYSRSGIGENNIYVDNLEFDGIHIISPKNMTQNIIGKGISSEQDEFNLEIIPEEDLVWKAYSLNGDSNVTFTGDTVNVSLPESNGVYTIQVFGNNSLGTMFESAIRYFTIEYPISIRGMPNGAILHNTDNELNVSIDDFYRMTDLTYSFQGNPEESVVNNSIIISYIPFGEWEIEVFGKDVYGDTYSSGLIQFSMALDTHVPSVADDFTFTNGALIEPFGDLEYIDGNYSTIQYDFNYVAGSSQEVVPIGDITTEWHNPTSGYHFDDVYDKNRGTGNYIAPSSSENLEVEEFECTQFALPAGHHIYKVIVWANILQIGTGVLWPKISWDDGNTWGEYDQSYDEFVEQGVADDYGWEFTDLRKWQTDLNQLAIHLQSVGITPGPPPGGIIVYCLWLEVFYEKSDSELEVTVDLNVEDPNIYEVEYLKYSHRTNVSTVVDLDIWDWNENQWDQVEAIDNSATFYDKKVVLRNESDYLNSTNGVRIRFQTPLQNDNCQLEIDMLKLWYSTDVVPENLFKSPIPDNFSFTYGTIQKYGELGTIDGNYTEIRNIHDYSIGSQEVFPNGDIFIEWQNPSSGTHYDDVDDKNKGAGDYISGNYLDNMQLEEFRCSSFTLPEGHHVYKIDVWVNMFHMGNGGVRTKLSWDNGNSWSSFEYCDQYIERGFADDFRFTWDNLNMDQAELNEFSVGLQAVGCVMGPPPGGVIVYCVWIEVFHEKNDLQLDFQVDLQIDDQFCEYPYSISYSFKTNVSATIDFDIWNWETNTWIEIESISNSVSFDEDLFILDLGSDYVNPANGVRLRFQSDDDIDFQLEIEQLRLDFYHIG
ncbi:MAG: hypothetical protein ACFFD7_02095 [Candidatus Thorarchaeota archaeon]